MTANTTTQDAAAQKLIDALLGIVDEAMARWQCGPEEAVARLRVMQQESVSAASR